MLPELRDLPEEERRRLLEEARYRLARRRPAFGVMLLAIGIGIPALTTLVSMLLGTAFFTSTLLGRLCLSAVVAVSSGVAVLVVQRVRNKAIMREVQTNPDTE